MDRLSVTERSAVMARVGSTDSASELAVRRELHRRGLRYSLHRKDLPGKPDVVFRRARTVLFIHGCFWHLHSCKRGRLPESNRLFWRKKLEANRERDARQIRLLREAGWKVIVIWTCRLSTDRNITRACDRVEAVVRQRR
jgi:DNA mismatch endonuclease, patch repair protein